MSWVFDATPLIYLAKADRLAVLETLAEPRLVPRPVYREVVTTGIEGGYADARRIERRVEDGLLEVVDADVDANADEDVDDSTFADRLARHPGSSDADVAVLACADARDAVAVVDGDVGRSVAEVEGIETRGTASLVLSAVKEGAIAPEAGRETIDAMVDRGWYLAPDLYAAVVRKLESFE
ncbi:DUF3368 domain-containing protein [Halalkaliarchaeum sp. AArc-GB]|uniref:DUF3368 domain-containing protein n=1 Tax=Halalkaliarchaeum sp. AArc-GB TaxID=3074078 RepID=UPI00285E2F62|nr:DUF3368 domain-containing protein [Halalkaliarchaeum sp. AArc-GB]MDR5673200.1 DUF3368 domain-containing protein [Halalkaliarchaeum sp. AArc-GB]